MANEIERLKALGGDVPTPDEASMNRARGLLQRRIGDGGGKRRRRWRPLHLRWALAGAAVLVGSGFGFGLGSWSTQEGGAGTMVGLGFLPAKGWTVVQSVTGGVTAARAIAANVPLHPDDSPGETPRATLAALPPDGVVMVATFTPRGDLHHDVQFPISTLPVQLANTRTVTAQRLRAGVGAYNVDIRIHFGSAPSAATSAAAQNQLNRLLVASEPITIATRTSVLNRGQSSVTLFGAIGSGKADEQVIVEGKACGPSANSFRQWVSTYTRAGGGWSTLAHVGTTTTFRARQGEAVSAVVTVSARPGVSLVSRGAGLQVRVTGLANFWRKRVDIQRYDRRLGSWTKIRSVLLLDNTFPGSIRANFTLRVPRNSLVRAVIPRSQTRPCYLAGYSNLLRT